MQILKEFAQEEAPLHILCRILHRDTLKIHNYLLLAPFIGYLLTFVLIFFLQRVDISLERSAYAALAAKNNDLGRSEFEEIGALDEWWGWIGSALEHAAVIISIDGVGATFGNSSDDSGGSRPMPAVLPVDLIMVRQLRALLGTCTPHATLDPVSRHRMGSTCALTYSKSQRAQPFGGPNGTRFLPNHMRSTRAEDPAATVNGIKKEGFFYDFSNVGNEFVELFYLADDADTLHAQLRALRRDGFTDALTRALVVDFFSFIPSKGQVVASSFTLEIDRNGVFLPTVFGHVMHGFDLRTPMKRFIFTLDVFLFLETLFFFASLAHEIRQKRILAERWFQVVEPWELFTFLMGCLNFAVSVARFMAYDVQWGLQRDAAADPRVGARAFAAEYIGLHELYTLIFDLMCFALLFFGFKLFFFVQYISGLNIITATLRKCVEDLVALGVFALVLLAAYATAGVVIFGQVLEQMRTVWHSASYLMRAAIAAELNEYDIFHQFQPVVTYLFFGSFFIFFWIMVLNLTLGVTSAAFLEAASSRDHDNPWQVFLVFFLLRGPIFEIDRHTHGKIEVHEMSSCVRAASQALRLRGTFSSRYIFLHRTRRTKRTAFVILRNELKLHRSVSEATISRERLTELLPDLEPNMRNALFNEALQEARLGTTTTSVAEQRHQRLMLELTTINKQALHLFQSLDDFRAQVRQETFVKSVASSVSSPQRRGTPKRGLSVRERRPLTRRASVKFDDALHVANVISESSSSSFSDDDSVVEVLVPETHTSFHSSGGNSMGEGHETAVEGGGKEPALALSVNSSAEDHKGALKESGSSSSRRGSNATSHGVTPKIPSKKVRSVSSCDDAAAAQQAVDIAPLPPIFGNDSIAATVAIWNEQMMSETEDEARMGTQLLGSGVTTPQRLLNDIEDGHRRRNRHPSPRSQSRSQSSLQLPTSPAQQQPSRARGHHGFQSQGRSHQPPHGPAEAKASDATAPGTGTARSARLGHAANVPAKCLKVPLLEKPHSLSQASSGTRSSSSSSCDDLSGRGPDMYVVPVAENAPMLDASLPLRPPRAAPDLPPELDLL